MLYYCWFYSILYVVYALVQPISTKITTKYRVNIKKNLYTSLYFNVFRNQVIDLFTIKTFLAFHRYFIYYPLSFILKTTTYLYFLFYFYSLVLKLSYFIINLKFKLIWNPICCNTHMHWWIIVRHLCNENIYFKTL